MDRAALGRNGIEKVRIGGLTMDVFRYQTPEGFDDLLMSTDGTVLTGLWFTGSRDENKHLSRVVETRCATSLPPIIRDTFCWLDVYFTGRQPDFTPAYRMEDLTPFRKTVLDIVREIPFGKTMTYGDIAKRIVETFPETSLNITEKPRKMSAQAVGGAVGWNPICIIVPCHRVMGANGNLTGYGGGIHNKIALLKLEGCLS
jgi:methylated-DNA-[protein]-cysteine S-methyltransferase